ncbi:T9SS type A sorting domain-containing protein [Yeosuana sp. AK3]
MKKHYVFLMCLISCMPFVSFSQIVNTGTLQIQNATTIYFGEAYTNTATGLHYNDGDLYLNHDFINDGATSSISGTTFFKSATHDLLSLSGSTGFVHFYNMAVDVTSVTKQGISVANGFGVFVENSVHLESGDMRLVGEAQLIQTHLGANTNSATSGRLLRDQQGISNVYGFNYWSSPVTNGAGSFAMQGGLYDGTDAGLNPFTPQQVSFNTGDPYNGIPAVLDGSNNVLSPLQISDRWLYKYAPNTTGYAGWEAINKDTALLPGEGFTMKGTGFPSQNYVFRGLPNTGTYTFTINAGEFALLGNPYPSALDATQFITDNLSTLDKIQIWVDGGTSSHTLSSYYGGYAIRNISGGVAPSIISSIAGVGSVTTLIPKQYLAVGQGFFVNALSNGIITIDNSQRAFQIEDGVDSNFYKSVHSKDTKSNEPSDPTRRVSIGYENPDLFHRQLLLAFLTDPEADLNYNVGYDALMTDPREDELFYIIENDLDKKYVIQGVGVYDNAYEFPLGLSMTQEGNHTITLDAVENFTDPVYIKDALLNTYHNLTESDLTINVPVGDYLDRFFVVFKASETLGNPDSVFSNHDVNAYFKNNTIIINNKNQVEIHQVRVYNAVGQTILDLKMPSHDESIRIPFVHPQGLYIVLIESGSHKKSFKIIN